MEQASRSGRSRKLRRLLRNPRDRRLVEIVEESRFIASSDLFQIDGRNRRDLAEIVRQLKLSGHLRVVSSAQRLPPNFYPKKTYVYTVGDSARGHIIHWLYIAHLRALFTEAARRCGVPLGWAQHSKHKVGIPDARIEVFGKSYDLEVDNSTEGMRLDRVAGKVTASTLIVAFRSEARFQNLAGLGGLSTYHGYFHEEEDGFNILSEPIWWDGGDWISLV